MKVTERLWLIGLILCAVAVLITGIVYAITQTYSSSPNQSIPDGAANVCPYVLTTSTSDNIGVSQLGSITEMMVQLSITHAWVGDLVIDLTSPAGTTIRLVDGIGSDCGNCDGSDLNVTLADTAGIIIEDACGSQNSGATFAPQQALSSFNGESAAGTWTLTVYDNFAADIGILNSWSMTINTTDPLIEVTQELVLNNITPEKPRRFFLDGRINRYDESTPIVVYPMPENEGLIIRDAQVARDLLVVSQADIAAVPTQPTSNTLIASANGVQVWRLSSGEFQIMAPTDTGKMYVLIFPVINDSTPYTSHEE